MTEQRALLNAADVVVGVLAAAGFAAFVVAGLEPGPRRAAAPEPAATVTEEATPAPVATAPPEEPSDPATASSPEAADPTIEAEAGPAAAAEVAAGAGAPSPAAAIEPTPAAPAAPKVAAPPPQVVPRPDVTEPPPPLPTAVGPASLPRIDPTQAGDGLSTASPASSRPINPALIPRNPTMQFIVRLRGEDRLKFRDAFVADPDGARAEFARWASQDPAFEGMELRRVSFNGELTLVYSAEPGLDENAMTALSQRLAARMQTHPTVEYADPDTLGGKGEAEP